jgi:hypothetical protein
MWLRKFAQKYPLEYAGICFFVGTLPQWIASVWSLWSSEPLAYKLSGGLNMSFPELSGYWISIPIGLLMFGYLLYALSQKVHTAQSPHDLFFLSVERFLSDHDARTKILAVLLLICGVWVLVLQNRIHHLEVQMVMYVLPRSLTNDQIEAFGKYLRENSKPYEVRIKYVMGDAESERYAADFFCGI